MLFLMLLRLFSCLHDGCTEREKHETCLFLLTHLVISFMWREKENVGAVCNFCGYGHSFYFYYIK